ncbi:hypothetical protein [Cryptosporangium sp. NPDC048952]|uniref:hypothetical protein n=1 Tax=Cryptosporangium sp. NPDC048952 TaxID=3363961 RepID=UPI003714F095
MASELERIAGRLRFLSDQAQQHRRPVLDASRNLREAAQVVGTFSADQPEGRPAMTAPASLAAQLSQAAERARQAEAPLSQTTELLRVFASRLSGGGASVGGRTAGGTRASGAGTPAPTTGSTPDDRAPAPDRGTSESTSRTTNGAGSVGPSRYGRYPTTTPVGLSPGDRSYEVGRQPQ